MFRIFPRLLLVPALLATTTLFTGCIADKSLVLSPEFQGTREEPVVQETDDPDMQLVSTEPESGLDLELAALSETGQWGETSTQTSPPKIEPPAEVKKSVEYDFPVTMNKQVNVYLDLFQKKQRKMFGRWLERSTRYLPMMHEELEKAGLPLDLVYLSMIESGYNQRAYSRARAVGLWQFMRATGKEYNLVIDKHIDERRDAAKATTSAVAFLGDLYKQFGDWHLAVAAYNAGPGKMRSGLKKYKVDNFWDLAKHRHLRLETKRYVPKLIAAIIIAKDPEKYGFTDLKYMEPLAYDSIHVGPGLSLDAIAVIAGSNTKTIKDLNPELRKGKTPANRTKYAVKIPVGSKGAASQNLDRLHSYVSTGFRTHKIRKGESLAAICRKYNINTTTLLKVNNLRSRKLAQGTNLRIPYSTIKYQLLPKGDKLKLAAYRDNLILHKIKNGETISRIATKYGVPPEMIASWNGLKSVHKIRAGQQLALYIHDESKPRKTKRIAKAKRTSKTPSTGNMTVLAAHKKSTPNGQPAKPDYSWYRVKNGDSLWTISRKFKTSAAKIRKWNNLKSNLIHPGSRLKLKKA